VSRDAFMGRVESLLDPAYRLASVMLLDFAAAEDAVHDATLEGWARYRRLTGDVDGFSTWFLTIVARRCRRMRWRRRFGLGVRGEGPEAADLVSGMLLSLGTVPRAALFCQHVLGLTREQTAVVLDMPLSRVRDRVYRAEERLLDEVDKDVGINGSEPEHSGREDGRER